MERNTVKIKCNPYTQIIEYYRWNSEKKEWSRIISPQSPFSKTEFTNCTLQHKANEILNYMDQKYNTGNNGLDIVFEGTNEDMEHITSIKEHYFPSSDIIIKSGDMYLLSAKVVKEEIENSFRDMKKMFKDYTNEVTDSIKRFSDTVRSTIPICVMGLYSAGKSAFINSLIGVELLPSASDPTTAKTYKISFGETYEIKFVYADKEEKNIVLTFDEEKYRINQSAENEIVSKLEVIKQYNTLEERMYYALNVINDFDMEYNRNCTDGDKLFRVSDLIEVTIPAKSSVLPFNDFDFVLYDTPGSNSASNNDHIEVLKKAMKDQTNGLPIYVTTPDNMDGKDNGDLIENIEKLGKALDKSNLMVVVNKSDEKDCKALDEKKANFKKLKLSELNLAGVYFVSSIMGIGFKKLLSNNSEKIKEENDDGEMVSIIKPKWIDKTYDFVFGKNRKYFNSKKNPHKLYEYNIVPEYQLDKYMSLELDDKEYAYRNSGLHAIENAIKDFAENYALYNKCKMAGGYLYDALEILKNILNDLKKSRTEYSNKLRNQMTEQQKELINSLTKECDNKKTQYVGEFSDMTMNFVSERKEYLSNTINESLKKIWNKIDGDAKNRMIEPVMDQDLNVAEKISKTVLEICNYMRGELNIESGRKEHMIYQTNELLNEKLKEYREESEKKAVDFWKEKEEDFKSSLISIIVGSKNLSKEQQSLLKEIILALDLTLDYCEGEISGDNIVGSRLLVFKWLKEDAGKEFVDQFEIGCAEINSDLSDKSTKKFDDLINKVNEEFDKLVVIHNPEMYSLGRNLEKCSIEINRMNDQRKQIKKQLKKIKNLTDFCPKISSERNII